AQAARAEVAAHDVAMAVRTVGDEADARLARNQPTDLDDAWRELLEIKRTGETAKLSTGKLNPIPPRLAFIAELRDDLASAHERADKTGKPSPAPDAIAMTGRVVDPAGKAVPGARVVTWHGELSGDATRVYRRPNFPGDIATTDVDGK